MRIAVTGATGLVGTQCVELFRQAGHEVFRLVRSSANLGEYDVLWNPAKGVLDRASLAGLDAVIHLAGENIARGRWSASKKKRILASRLDGTRLLSQALAALDDGPKILISASAIGYYGDTGATAVDEFGPNAHDFLARVCRLWEAETEVARRAGVRVVNARIGVVLSCRGGALAQMLPPFRLGVGGVLGAGTQYLSWITLRDVARALLFAVEEPRLEGGVNFVANGSITNRDFTKILGRVLGRPTVFPVPGLVARIALGEMADALLLVSTRVSPRKLESCGFAFCDPTLEEALRAELGSK